MKDDVAAIDETITIVNKLNGTSSDAASKLLIGQILAQLHRLRASLMHTQHSENSETYQRLVVKDGHYYLHDGDGPFCTPCWDDAGKLIRLSPMTGEFKVLGDWKCGVCRNII